MSTKINNGDALWLMLDYTVGENNTPLEDFDFDDIEFSLGEKQYLFSAGDIVKDSNTGKYCLYVSQEDTFDLVLNVSHYQIRIKQGDLVFSDDIRKFVVGDSISDEVI